MQSPVKRQFNNGSFAPQPLAPLAPVRLKKKYRHVAAAHSIPKTSCLSHESKASPSFLGFRNLMVIVLSQLSASWSGDGELMCNQLLAIYA